MTQEQMTALRSIAGTVIEACQAAPVYGAPGGLLYAGLMAAGCTLSQFEQIMSGLVRAGYLVKNGECYSVTEKGKAFSA